MYRIYYVDLDIKEEIGAIINGNIYDAISFAYNYMVQNGYRIPCIMVEDDKSKSTIKYGKIIGLEDYFIIEELLN